ncbi:diversity-generating retroelement protein Avd [Candidatus Venteria ishoeyi]|uniref:bAvd-like domain-containing protein n=1 Tax=Candidatus Venteria ishoeyi TaxID=1899563 RepID=A0A1H6FC64_9GAMM|nr:diversity-generating retroelement protein Avd [Candidatus Venteria ishoeyi]SEH06634.1 Uncharacterised protein [Candidatus Venteria ishoeyi]
MRVQKELSIIQKTHDFIGWYVPILNKMPLDFKLTLGRRIMDSLYDLLSILIKAKFHANKNEKLHLLLPLNPELEVMRHQTRLLYEFGVFSAKRYEYASKGINEIGVELGGWLRSLQQS